MAPTLTGDAGVGLIVWDAWTFPSDDAIGRGKPAVADVYGSFTPGDGRANIDYIVGRQRSKTLVMVGCLDRTRRLIIIVTGSKRILSIVCLVLALLLGVYSAASIVAVRGVSTAMPSRYRSIGEDLAVHDSNFTLQLPGVVAVTRTGEHASLLLGSVKVPLLDSEAFGWTIAGLAVTLLGAAIIVAIRRSRTE